MEWIILGIAVIAFMFLSGCNKKPKPEPPEPEPEPEPKWEIFYPVDYTLPAIDLGKLKWEITAYGTEIYNRYVKRVDWWNENIERLPIVQKGEINDRKLFAILHLKNSDGSYKFRWTSDMERWDKKDHWASPENFLTLVDEDCRVIEPEEFEPNPEGFYRDDCDGFCRKHCKYLIKWCKYYLSFFLEVYWEKLLDNGTWKGLGHAITVYKKTPESNWGCFSNQQWLSASGELTSFMGFVYKFVPVNNPDFKDKYRLTRELEQDTRLTENYCGK